MDVRFSFPVLIDISGYNHAEVLLESHFAMDHTNPMTMNVLVVRKRSFLFLVILNS